MIDLIVMIMQIYTAMRFRGENIANILSYLFVDTAPNVKDGKDYQAALRAFDSKVQDTDFDDFYKKINTGYEKISLSKQ